MTDPAVLLIEDNPEDAFLFRRAFLSIMPRASVAAVADVRAAERYLLEGRDDPEFRPSAIFVDLRLPGLDGGELLNWIDQQPHLANANVYVLSGSVGTVGSMKSEMGRVVTLLPKPVNGFTLAAALPPRA